MTRFDSVIEKMSGRVRVALFLCVFALGVGLAQLRGLVLMAAEAAPRNDLWADPSKVERVFLSPLTDGGCKMQSFAYVNKLDGGNPNETTKGEFSAERDLSGAAQTDCLQALNRGLLLFRQTNNF